MSFSKKAGKRQNFIKNAFISKYVRIMGIVILTKLHYFLTENPKRKEKYGYSI